MEILRGGGGFLTFLSVLIYARVRVYCLILELKNSISSSNNFITAYFTLFCT